MLYYGNYERQDEINERMQPLQLNAAGVQYNDPVFDIRPVPTKYTTTAFPVQQPYLGKTTTPVHYSGFNVDTESQLFNKNSALQKGGIQGTYIPSSNSTLYKVPITYSPSVQPFPDLFKREQFQPVGLPSELAERGVGTQLLNNHTRGQMR